jgi:translation initiation factor IF-3
VVRSHSRLPNNVRGDISISEKRKNRVNEQIRVPYVRFIDETGTLVAERHPTPKALAYCRSIGMDLVEVVPNANPPVCKALDFGRFKFQAAKKKQTVKKQQLKEIKLRPAIGEGDYKVKLKKTLEFLEAGNKVKISLRFRGREIMHADLGFETVNRMVQDLDGHCVVEKAAAKDGRQIIAIVGPKKVAV